MELRTVKQYMKSTEKEIQLQTRREKIAKRQKVCEAKMEAEKQKQTEKCRLRVERVYQVQKENELKLHNALLEAEYRNRIFKQRIHQRVVVAAEIEHKKKIEALFQKQAADYKQKKKKDDERRTREEEKKKRIQERWDQKVHIQKFQIMRENKIRNMRADSLKERAWRREKKNLHVKYLRELNLDILKEKQHAETLNNVKLTDAGRKKFYAPPPELKKKDPIRGNIAEIVIRFKNHLVNTVGSEGEYIFLPSEDTSDKRCKVPEEVDIAITFLFDAVIKHFVKSYVELEVASLIRQVLQVYNAQKTYWVKKYGVGRGKRESFVQQLLCIASQTLNETVGVSEVLSSTKTEQLISSTLPALDDSGTCSPVSIEPDTTSSKNSDHSFKSTVSKRSEKKLSYSTVMKSEGFKEEDVNDSILPDRERFFNLINYLSTSILVAVEIKIVNYFYSSSNITDLPEISDMDLKKINLIEYITSTLLYFAGSRLQIDKDVCVSDISDFFARHILYLVE